MVEPNSSFVSYLRFLRSNKQYRILWLGEVVNYTGTWFNYIATLSLTETYGSKSGILLSITVILRFLPSCLWCAFAGALADKCNRRKILVWTCLLDAAVVSCLTAVQSASQLWLMYVLIFLQFSIGTFYEPARRALVPLIVTPVDLPLATTLDGVCWSLTAAVGAVCGGLAASKLGITACFLIDSCTYLVAAACAAQLDPTAVNPPPVNPLPALQHDSPSEPLLSSVAGCNEEDAAEDKATHGADQGEGGSRQCSPLSYLCMSYVSGMSAIKEGARYMMAVENRDVCVLVFVKASGALVWGAGDVLNVRLAELASMQSLGDADTTLGVIYTALGLGCLLGPFTFNQFTQPQQLPLLRGIAAAFCLLTGGYVLLYLSTNIFLLAASTVVHAMGSATLWTYGILIIQVRVPNHVLGRVMAVEASMDTLFQSLSALSSGVALDATDLTLHQLIAIVMVMALGLAGWWVLYSCLRWMAAKAVDEVEGCMLPACVEQQQDV